MRQSVDINSLLLISIRADHFAGHDPLLALNSKYIKPARAQRYRTVSKQPVYDGDNHSLQYAGNECRSPMEAGLYVLGLLEDYRRTGYKLYLKDAKELADWLLASRCDIENWGRGWGHPFDMQVGAYHVLADSPNLSTTAFIGRVLHELGVLTGTKRLIFAAVESARFISSNLYAEVDGRSLYAFAPGTPEFSHNGNLAAAAWCAFIGSQLGDEMMKQQALAVAHQSVERQAVNGSWGYDERQRDVMSYNMGSSLEALCQLRSSLETIEFDVIIERGFNYYRQYLFAKEGLVKNCSRKLYPLHMQNVAQAVFTLTRGGDARDAKLCDMLVETAIDLLYQPEKRKFAWQKNRWTTNRNTRAGWTQAWAYAALACYNRYRTRNVTRNIQTANQTIGRGMLDYYVDS